MTGFIAEIFSQSINRKANGAVHFGVPLNLFCHLDQQVFYITDYSVNYE